MDQVLEDQTIKVWIGFLGAEFTDHVQTHLGFFEAYHYFDSDEEDPKLPFAPALIEVAQEHFAFFSANEDDEQEEDDTLPELIPDESGSVPVEQRLLLLEKSLVMLTKGMETLLKDKAPRPKASSKAKATPKMKAAPQVRPSALRKGKKIDGEDPATAFPALDAGVVQAAIQAGVPKENLEEMQRLIGQNSKAAAVKDLNKVSLHDPLSEEEDGGEAAMQRAEGSGLAAPVDPVVQSLSKLTSIIEVLTDDRKKKSRTKLDEALDAVGVSSTDSLGIGSGKKNAAARRALRATFEDHPEEIHRMIERLMYEDLQSRTSISSQLVSTQGAGWNSGRELEISKQVLFQRGLQLGS